MMLVEWHDSLRPYFCEAPPALKRHVEKWAQNTSYGLCCVECGGTRWKLAVLLEPDLQLTNCEAEARCVGCERRLLVFAARQLGWEYPKADLSPLSCACENDTLELLTVFEHPEDAEGEADIGWFWLFAGCPSCQAVVTVVDWEID